MPDQGIARWNLHGRRATPIWRSNSGDGTIETKVDIAGGVVSELRQAGYVHLAAEALRDLIDGIDADEFATLAVQWEGMPLDEHMADGGRYRRRRHAAFTFQGDEIVRKPHQPHYQSTNYNALNGGLDRWFEPATEALTGHPLMRRIISTCTRIFSSAEGGEADPRWNGELHQFRIEARAGALGLPTPEGMHRDGVDCVVVLLIDRLNVEAGSTRIVDEEGRVAEFTLRDPGEAVLLDDRRIRHGVTAISAVDPDQPAHRDVLVVTWSRASSG